MVIRWILLTLFILSSLSLAQRQEREGRSGYAQDILWRSFHKSTQDSIRAAVGDSINATLPDSIFEYLPRVVQYKDTVQMKLAAPDSAGMFVYLTGLSSANGLGEGILVSVAAASYATDGVTVFATGNASYEWVRIERIQGLDWNVEWAGMLGDDSSDNLAAFNLMYPKVAAANTGMFFPEGTFRFSDSLRVYASAIHRQTPMISGKGYDHTTLKWTTDKVGIKITKGGTAAAYQPIIKNLQIEGPGLATSTKAGIRADTTHMGKIEGVYFVGWKWCLYTDQANALVVERCWWNTSKIGASFQNSSNEFTVLNCYSSSDIDSLTYVFGTGTKGAALIGGGYAGAPTHIYAVNGAKINIISGNYESAEDYFFQAEANASIRIKGTQIGNPDTLGLAAANARIEIYGIEGLGAGYGRTILQTAATPDILNYGTTDIRIYDQTNNAFFYAQKFVGNPSTGSFTADSSNRGRMFYKWRTPASTGEDGITFVSQVNDSTYHTKNLIKGTDWRFSVTGVQPSSSIDRLRFVTGSVVSSATANLDSTRISVPLDTLGYQSLYYAGGTVDLDNVALVGAEYNWNVMVLDQNHTSNTGKVEFIIHHAALTSTTSFRLRYLLIGRANQSWATD